MQKQTYITKEGLEKITKELDELRNVKRKEIASRIQEAKELGDLSENAEYAEAKNEQSFTEGRIAELESIVKNAVIIEKSQQSGSTVQVGSLITVKNSDASHKYHIVGSNEADPSRGFISNESPLGQALIMKRVGDVIKMNTPKGEQTIEVLEIE